MSKPTVAVSGVTGYIGAHVAATLLRRGYTVHGTVRRDTPHSTAHLESCGPGTLRVFEADLLTPHSFDAATDGCDSAVHVASPWTMTVDDPQTQLVDPAVEGTLNFLRSCRRAGISKVVVTSSDAAIADGGQADRVFDENDWNVHSSVDFLPYYFAKAEAERQARKFADTHGMHLIAINPPTVLGPSLTARVNESAYFLLDVARRNVPGVLDLQLAVVDVRDVAEAHVRALESEHATGRYVCCPPAPMLHARDVARMWRANGFDPKMNELTHPAVTTVLRWCAPLWAGSKADAQFIGNHLGTPLVLSSQKIVDELGMTFRSAEETASDAMKDLLKWGHVTIP